MDEYETNWFSMVMSDVVYSCCVVYSAHCKRSLDTRRFKTNIRELDRRNIFYLNIVLL